ncbi:MAG TPA: Ku protein [Candidatus Acidoferrales bacterium]|jgi:DNA end-binding protein Ku|nr:Ku protein [Candidatus Acidoferrales bacterium]
MAASAWKGFISFGLISIPVRLYAAARRSRFALHQLHRKCHTRLRQPLFCPTCNRPVEKSEVVKGFEYEEGKYALIEPEEIKKIEPPSARSMDVLAFVKSSEIDPLFFESSYFLVPEEQGRKPYQLLLKALEDTRRVAIAKVTMHQREYTAFIRPYDRGLALHTMYYANEVREAPGYGKTDGVKLNPKEVKLAEQLIENLSEDFNIQKYHDEFQERLHELIEAKRKGHETAAEVPQPRRAPVIDMMTALKKSLENAGSPQKQRVGRAHSHKPAARRAS